MTEALEKRGPGRPRREDTERAARRRRAVLEGYHPRRLALNEDGLEREAYEYRWVNDVPGRVDRLYREDWDVVSDRDGLLKDDSADAGAKVSVHAGVQENNSPMRAVLMRKPRELYQDDASAAQRRIDETEAAMSMSGERKMDGGYDPDGEGLRLTRAK